jgi:hypothetical protein
MHSRLETFKRKLCSSLRYIVAKEVLLAPAITVLFSLMSSCSSYAKTDALGVVDFRLLQRALIVVPIYPYSSRRSVSVRFIRDVALFRNDFGVGAPVFKDDKGYESEKEKLIHSEEGIVG